MKSWLYIIVSVSLLVLSVSASAAYRVYVLKVESYGINGRLLRVNQVISTLDQLQYENYNAGYRRMKVSLMDTWYCPGDTSRWRPYCPKPKWVDRWPANLDHAKQVPLPYNRQPVIP